MSYLPRLNHGYGIFLRILSRNKRNPCFSTFNSNHHPSKISPNRNSHHHLSLQPDQPSETLSLLQTHKKRSYTTKMADTMMQYQCVHKGSDFRLETVPKPTPGPTEVCIRIKAVALNALDWGMWTRGEMIHSYPATFGLDGAGIVESVGEEVTAFKPGDEVFSLCGIGGKAAAFQEIATVPQYFVSKKPESHSFEEVASLPYDSPSLPLLIFLNMLTNVP